MIGQAQLPAVIQVVLQGQVQGLVVVADAPVVRLAKERRAADRAQFVVHRRDPTIKHRFGARKLAVDRQQRVRAQLPAQRRADDTPLTANVVAKTAVVLHRHVDPRQHAAVFAQWRVHIQAAAIAVPAAGAGLELREGLGLGTLGDDVHQATWIPPPVQAGRRPLEHLDAFDVRGVWGAVTAAVDGKAILVQLAGGETAHAVIEEGQATEVVLPAHPAGKIQGPIDTGAVEVFQHLARHHGNALWGVADVGVGLGRGAGAVGAIALHRTCSGLFDVALADGQGIEQHRLGGGSGQRQQ
ncbi:hypothetical protein D3C81_915520 [compost metagenome]